MTKNTKMLLGVAAVAAVGYYFYTQSKKPTTTSAGTGTGGTTGFATANGRLVASSLPNFNALGGAGGVMGAGKMGASSFFNVREARGGNFQATGRKRNASGRKLKAVMREKSGFAA